MSDKEFTEYLKFVRDADLAAINEAKIAAIREENISTITSLLKRVSESLDCEFDDVDDGLDESSSAVASALKSAVSGLSGFALKRINKLVDKVNPTAVEDMVVRDVISSYSDELRLIKNKHEPALTIYSSDFWNDIFDMLGVTDHRVEAGFLKTYKSNLVDLRNDTTVYKKKIIEAMKSIKISNGDKEIDLVSRYKSLSAIMASKHKDTLLGNKEFKAAMNEYKSFVSKSFKTGFMPLFSALVQTMTVDYLARKNKSMAAEGVNAQCRFTLFEEQYLLLQEYDSK